MQKCSGVIRTYISARAHNKQRVPQGVCAIYYVVSATHEDLLTVFALKRGEIMGRGMRLTIMKGSNFVVHTLTTLLAGSVRPRGGGWYHWTQGYIQPSLVPMILKRGWAQEYMQPLSIRQGEG
jgi:hypothetical protein